MRHDWLLPALMVLGCVALVAASQWQHHRQLDELRQEVSRLQAPTTPTGPGQPLPPAPFTSAPPATMPGDEAIFRQVFRHDLESRLAGEELSEETRSIVRDALRRRPAGHDDSWFGGTVAVSDRP